MSTDVPDPAVPDPAVPDPPGPPVGLGILRADIAGTIALVVAVVADAVVPSRVTDVVLLAVAAVLFLGGTGIFFAGFLRAVGRSRYEIIDLAGLFYLTGTAPPRVRTPLLRLWFVQIAVAVISLGVNHPPFGAMAPLWGIGLLTLWGARHGTFPPQPADPRRGR